MEQDPKSNDQNRPPNSVQTGELNIHKRTSESSLAFIQKWVKKIGRSLASLKLAIFVIISLAILIGTGTILESRYDATAASKWVYRSFWMYGILSLLAVNLIAVMVNRWPWKKRHIPFLCAHIGILILLLGSWVTAKWGVDGNLAVGIGKSSRFVATPETELTVWSSFDGDRFSRVAHKPVDFFLDRPKEKPLELVSLDKGTIRVIDYEPYVSARMKIAASENPRAGSAIQFFIANDRFSDMQWLLQKRKGETAKMKLGGAQIVFGNSIPPEIAAEKILQVESAKGDQFLVSIWENQKVRLKKRVSLAEPVQTPWMGLNFKVIQMLERADEKWEIEKLDRPQPKSTAAILLEVDGKQHWLQINDVLKLFTEKAAFLISYAQRRIDLGFDVHLKDFRVGRYQGLSKAMSYESDVEVGDSQVHTISMNEPLKYKGFTLYQASFQEHEGKPVASIFSVNADPGRFLKYLGSLILSLGVVWMFYDRRKRSVSRSANLL